jgi:serine/threonine protein kinase
VNPLPPLRTVRAAAPPAADRPPDLFPEHPKLPAAARELLRDVLALPLADRPAVDAFLAKYAEKLPGLNSRDRVGVALVQAGVLTDYQRDRVVAGSSFGLVLGPYRVLDRLGGGSVGVLFRGEHTLLRRQVALKVVPVDDAGRVDLRDRFHAEMRALAALDHPHVATVHDAGVLPSPGPGQLALHYLVLELVTGGDLEQQVYDRGLPTPAQACEWIRQAAAGVRAAHDLNLVHRDVKPSNLLLTTDGRMKVADFGLARQPVGGKTRPGTLLGSVEFMAPEQAADPASVGPPADVYGLGAVLFWLLTGQLPLPRGHSVAAALKILLAEKPRRVRELWPEAPAELDALLHKMLARDPADRPTAVAVMDGLTPFARSGAEDPAAEAARLRETIAQLSAALRARERDARQAERAVLYALGRMAEAHDGNTPRHAVRMQGYVRVLAEKLAAQQDWPAALDSTFVGHLISCIPVHDVGMVGMPDAVLQKVGALTQEEWDVLRTHPVVGCAILDDLAREYGDALPTLGVARAVVRGHHERWDGAGYPDGLRGDRVPPAARLVALADVYDSLRRDRPDRPGLDHAAAAAAILNSQGQFDPAVVKAFAEAEARFEEVFLTVAE